ncbi:MAG: ATP-dependent DNA helicase [Candidatus Omnitrophica bacterium]|nr:ATP-dependent DNA helicase [Candidatus Omnitrophota bacterium]
MKNYKRFYSELNDQQKLAVDTINGPLLVLAGPGTGKTQLLSVRAGSILEKARCESENILILTYTNAAAKAMKERLARVIGPRGYDVEVGTFHGFANSIIQESEEAANYVGDKIQMSEVEQVRAIEYALDNTKGVDEIRPFRAPYLYLDEILSRIAELKRDGITPEKLREYLKKRSSSDVRIDDKYMGRLKAFSIIYAMYEKLKEGGDKAIFDERGRYDFDDMILFATEALRNEKALSDKYRSRFIYVMVDEYQDTNGAQMEMLFTLLNYDNPNLCCVGDDDQSIYRFQGASVGNFKILKERFPGLEIMSLKNNYRSSKELIEASGKIINLIPQYERMEEKVLESVKNYREKEIEFRELSTPEEETRYIVDKVFELKGRIEKSRDLTAEEREHPYNNIAILVRKRRDILRIIDAFLHAGIPYATDGKEDISGEKRVRQLLDILELAHITPQETELKDLALYKVLTADYFEIPTKEILQFILHLNAKREKDKSQKKTLLSEFLSYFGEGKKKDAIASGDNKNMRRAAETIKKLLNESRARPVHALLMDYIKEAGIYRYILREYRDEKVLKMRELRSLSSFVNMVKAADIAMPAMGLDDFMLEMKTRKDHGLPIKGDVVTMTQDGVRIFTAHGSKGQEFHSVIIPFCLQNKNWPARPIPEKIPMPYDLFKSREAIKEKGVSRQLFLNDETRLFYVAMTRAKSNLIFTSSPTEDSVSSFYLTGLDIDREGPQHVEEEAILQKSLETTDLNDPFIGTENVLKDLIKNMTLNPTRINNYITCRRKFLYNDILKLPGPKKKSLVFGNCVHKALEETYRIYKEKKVFPDFNFFRKAFEQELKFQGVEKSIETICLGEERMRMLERWFMEEAKSPVVPIGLERKLVITVGDGIIFTGKYDKVEWENISQNLVRVVDYKTGKPDNHLKAIGACQDLKSEDCDGYLRQLVAYKLLFERDKKESAGRKVSHGVLAFIEPVASDIRKLGYKKGDHVAKAIAISHEMVSEMEDIIKDVWQSINALQFERLRQRDKDICAKCDFDAICWG